MASGEGKDLQNQRKLDTGEKRKEIENGNRIKMYLKTHGITQRKLADMLGNGYQNNPSNLTAKLNGNGRYINEDEVDAIARVLHVRPEYFRGSSRFPTLGEEFRNTIQTAESESELLLTGFVSFAKLNGYTLDFGSISEQDDAETIVQTISDGYSLRKDGRQIKLSIEEMNRLENLICDQVDSILKYVFAEKGA